MAFDCWSFHGFLTHLTHSSWCGTDGVYHPQRHHQSGGQGEESTNSIPPPWVLIRVVELQGGILHNGEDKCGLGRERSNTISFFVRSNIYV